MSASGCALDHQRCQSKRDVVCGVVHTAPSHIRPRDDRRQPSLSIVQDGFPLSEQVRVHHVSSVCAPSRGSRRKESTLRLPVARPERRSTTLLTRSTIGLPRGHRMDNSHRSTPTMLSACLQSAAGMNASRSPCTRSPATFASPIAREPTTYGVNTASPSPRPTTPGAVSTPADCSSLQWTRSRHAAPDLRRDRSRPQPVAAAGLEPHPEWGAARTQGRSATRHLASGKPFDTSACHPQLRPGRCRARPHRTCPHASRLTLPPLSQRNHRPPPHMDEAPQRPGRTIQYVSLDACPAILSWGSRHAQATRQPDRRPLSQLRGRPLATRGANGSTSKQR